MNMFWRSSSSVVLSSSSIVNIIKNLMNLVNPSTCTQHLWHLGVATSHRRPFDPASAGHFGGIGIVAGGHFGPQLERGLAGECHSGIVWNGKVVSCCSYVSWFIKHIRYRYIYHKSGENQKKIEIEWDDFWEYLMIYPLVNVYKTMEHHHLYSNRENHRNCNFP